MCEIPNGYIGTKLPDETLDAILLAHGCRRYSTLPYYQIPIPGGFSLKQIFIIKTNEFLDGFHDLPSSFLDLLSIPFRRYKPVARIFLLNSSERGVRVDGDVRVVNASYLISLCSAEQTPNQRKFLPDLAALVQASVTAAETMEARLY